MAQATTAEPESKTFSLKPIEQQMLNVLEQQYFTTLSNFLSFISLERLAYEVTPNTQFKIEEGKLIITEVAAGQVPETPGADIATSGSDTKEALK